MACQCLNPVLVPREHERCPPAFPAMPHLTWCTRKNQDSDPLCAALTSTACSRSRPRSQAIELVRVLYLETVLSVLETLYINMAVYFKNIVWWNKTPGLVWNIAWLDWMGYSNPRWSVIGCCTIYSTTIWASLFKSCIYGIRIWLEGEIRPSLYHLSHAFLFHEMPPPLASLRMQFTLPHFPVTFETCSKMLHFASPCLILTLKGRNQRG